MDVFDTLRGRRSVRKYKSDPVSLDVMEKLVRAGQWAPTGANRQPWKFIVITDARVMRNVKRLSPMMWGAAPACIFVCLDLTRNSTPLEARTGLATGFPSQNVMLAAYALGLGTCPIGGFNRDAIRKLLDIPEDIEPMLLITVGYPDEIPKVKPRRPIAEIAYINNCRRPWDA